jgi:putative tryptophan/tyrosine transport system substrate-binding protein
MNRRECVVLLGSVAGAYPLGVCAQEGRVFRLASAFVTNEATVTSLEAAFLSVLRERGYAVGRNLIYESRYANGEAARLPALVDELIELRPNVLAGIEHVARVMMAKTSTIPIVLTNSSDPIAAGLVKSLSSPGRNVTGVSFQLSELGPKQMELLREVLPRFVRVAQMHDTNVPASKHAEVLGRETAHRFGLEYLPYYVATPADIDKAIAKMEKDRPDAWVGGGGSGMVYGLRKVLIDHALRLRIPYANNVADMAEQGCILTYGPNIEEGFRLAATYVDRIFKGAKPADLPVQQPTKFELVVNLRTAKALGLTIPQSVLIRADRLIE